MISHLNELHSCIRKLQAKYPQTQIFILQPTKNQIASLARLYAKTVKRQESYTASIYVRKLL